MESFSYFTLAGPSEGLYKEKGSKFLSFAFPVTSEDEAKGMLEMLRRKYFDARHHCYAYIIGHPGYKTRAFDSGEPNHSAGDPILGRIRARNLANVLVVVVRYFGGVKLGVGGLAQAYKAAAEEALARATAIEVEITEEFVIAYDYTASPEVMRLVGDFDLKILHQDFSESASVRVEVKSRDKVRFLEKVEWLRAMKVSLKAEPMNRLP